MIILHLYMRISYIQYTTCNKIMEEEKRGCNKMSFFAHFVAAFLLSHN